MSSDSNLIQGFVAAPVRCVFVVESFISVEENCSFENVQSHENIIHIAEMIMVDDDMQI